jgi:hypothetical protein
MADPDRPNVAHDVADVLDGGPAISRPTATPPNVCTLPRLRRELREFKAVVTSTLAYFRGRTEGRRIPPTDAVWAAVFEAALDLPGTLVLDRSDPRVKPIVEEWHKGRRPELSGYAEDNLELLLRTVHSSIAALSRLEAVGYPAPPSWSNLPAAILAREVNAFFEARTQQLPAWKDVE